MLVNTMYERGLNNDFANNLLEISTMVEHKEYVDFLQDLKSFFSSRWAFFEIRQSFFANQMSSIATIIEPMIFTRAEKAVGVLEMGDTKEDIQIPQDQLITLAIYYGKYHHTKCFDGPNSYSRLYE